MDDDSNSQTNDQEDTATGGGSWRQKRRSGTGVTDYTGELTGNYLFDDATAIMHGGRDPGIVGVNAADLSTILKYSVRCSCNYNIYDIHIF